VLINELAERLGRKVPVLGPQLEPTLAKAVVGEADALFGLRIHALVFAVSMGVPCLGVGWEERTTAFLAEHEQAAISTRPPVEDLHAWVDQTLPARWSARPRLLSS
jgi:polysaccharide pyruvyl transferase WcaK-like protein